MIVRSSHLLLQRVAQPQSRNLSGRRKVGSIPLPCSSPQPETGPPGSRRRVPSLAPAARAAAVVVSQGADSFGGTLRVRIRGGLTSRRSRHVSIAGDGRLGCARYRADLRWPLGCCSRSTSATVEWTHRGPQRPSGCGEGGDGAPGQTVGPGRNRQQRLSAHAGGRVGVIPIGASIPLLEFAKRLVRDGLAAP